ncbi:right-handed parallel beta-helix repeat-containing protein [Geodermatophilus marinus]|nr:right-handed parallel beta-helix repeat-containing protein [Geodermatophilus sp. LHW52908]
MALGLLTAGPAMADDHGHRWGGDRPHGESWGSDDRADRGDRDRGASDRLRVTTAADSADTAPGDGRCADGSGACSLRAAVQEANALGGGTIELGKHTYALTLGGTGEDAAATGDLDVTGRVTIRGGGATVDARGLDRVFDVRPGASLRLEHATVTGGAAQGTGVPASGGGLLNAGTLHLEGSTVTGNTAVRAGGGIEASAGSSTTVHRSTLSDNATGAGPGNGGGLHLTGAGTVTVERSAVTGNTAAAEGGGLWNSADGTMTVDRSTVVGNAAGGAEATNGGGGLFNDGGELTVRRTEVRDNRADGAAGSGGGVLNDQGRLVVERSVLSGNSSSRAGGGVEANLGETVLDRTRLTGNTTGAAPGNGGGLHLTGAGTVTVERSAVTGNTAAAEGGGLWNSEPGTMTVTRTEIRDNRAPVGPDVFQDGNGTGFTVDGRTVPANGS